MRKIIVTFTLLFASLCVSNAQLIREKGLEYCNRADSIVSQLLSGKTEGKTSIVFYTLQSYAVIITEESCGYAHYIVEPQADVSGKVDYVVSDSFYIKKKDKILTAIFDTASYRKQPLVTIESDCFNGKYGRSLHGDEAYFVLKDSTGSKYGESFLPFIATENIIPLAAYEHIMVCLLNKKQIPKKRLLKRTC